MAKDNIDAAGERLQRALEQLQASVDSVLNKAEHELSGSAKELTALHDEVKSHGKAEDQELLRSALAPMAWMQESRWLPSTS